MHYDAMLWIYKALSLCEDIRKLVNRRSMFLCFFLCIPRPLPASNSSDKMVRHCIKCGSDNCLKLSTVVVGHVVRMQSSTPAGDVLECAIARRTVDEVDRAPGRRTWIPQIDHDSVSYLYSGGKARGHTHTHTHTFY